MSEVVSEIKDGVSEIKKTASAYTKGAVIGGISLAIFALVTRRNVLLWGTIGVIGGGFIAYKVKESGNKGSSSNTKKFKNYDLEDKD